ncbi:hypothetical protein AMJ40_05575 [candidate division TA06 bacterium DG_26]|uniref:Uncharacterized protein n=1 Tax=candidate division TA06 bacterium DG_26 TaxID=1703771 RepID=A0A0S7WGY7_UNCT6|nr:MAG: hypothetical protein AMJ40_05575 [candidate division TA06 bacterium DG_26]
MERLHAWVALSCIEGIGERRLKALVEIFGTPEEVLRASRSSLKASGKLSDSLVERIVEFDQLRLVERHVEAMRRHHVQLITSIDSDYPESLGQLSDSPPLLYVRGQIRPQDRLAVALVGSRRATAYGKLMAQKLATGLAKAGVTVVSGMARGIDTVAHRSALQAGGRTIAVLGCGVDIVYPPENRTLMAGIIESGAVISEFPMGTEPLPGNFPARNRVISGLSLGVVAVEAGKTSGVFSTARWAAEQGRDVFAVPGNASSTMSIGTNILIRQGAKLTTDVEDIFEELGIRPPGKEEVRPGLSHEEEKVLNVLDSAPRHVDQIAGKVDLPVSHVLSVLLSLEMKEMVVQLPGKLFVRREG